MNTGILYFNTGRACLIRLIVSLYTLRKYYQGPIALIYTRQVEPEYSIIQKTFNTQLICGKEASEGKNRVLLEKCLLNHSTPFDISIFLDADTLIFDDPSELFDLADKNQFVTTQFSNWLVRGVIAKRVLAWKDIYPCQVEKIINKQGVALNTGVFAFDRKSEFFEDWYNLAIKGRTTYIPDEISCQLFVQEYPHLIVDGQYNVSCKYPNPSGILKIMHFHGKKHCRFGEDSVPINNSEIWLNSFKECYLNKISQIQELNWQEDKMIRKYSLQIKNHLGIN